jgi:hypothetical protein
MEERIEELEVQVARLQARETKRELKLVLLEEFILYHLSPGSKTVEEAMIDIHKDTREEKKQKRKDDSSHIRRIPSDAPPDRCYAL